MSINIFDCCDQNHNTPILEFSKFLNLNIATEDTDLKTEICGQIFYKNVILEEIDIVVRKIRKNWTYLQRVILYESTIPSCDLVELREVINKFMKLIVESFRNCGNENLKRIYLSSSHIPMETLSSLILPVAELEKEIYLKLTSSSSTKSKCPVYQFFHTLQDLHYYLLLYYYISGNKEKLEQHISFIIRDFIHLSHSGFKFPNTKNAFICECNKHFWLMIQILCEKVSEEEIFWSIFNKVIENNDCEYALWILRDVAGLQAFDTNGELFGGSTNRIKPNFPLLETSLKKVLAEPSSSTSILTILKSLEPLICDLWLRWSKIEIYQLLWEYFSKRLNTSEISNTNFTLTELVDLIDTILWTPKDCKRDFELFVSMLSMHLNEHPYHWGKMKGRIYSQLGPNKVKDLNNIGLFHVLLLFMSLTKVNFDEVSKKFLSFLENLPVEKRQSHLIWVFYKAFIVRHLRENRDIEVAVTPFIKMLEEASTDQKLFPLIKEFVKDFDDIAKCSVDFQLHQWLLINTWIHQYMTTCYYPDLIKLLNVLLNTIEEVNKQQAWCAWESSFKNYVFPTLNYVTGPRYGQSSPEIVGTIAAKIALLSPSLITEAFTFFNGESVAPKVSASFLSVILENYPCSFIMSANQETVALQTWVKFCLLTRDSYEDLTRHIVKLEIIPDFIKTAIASSKDPLCALIECIANNMKQQLQSNNVNKLCETIFGQAECWIAQYFTKPENEVIVLRVYTCVGLAFFKIGPLLYNKHKSSCPYARLINPLLLPTELITGRQIHTYIMQSVKKTWHLFFEATVKLNTPNDVFINRILQEMVVRYIPHFAAGDSPMLKCLDNELLAEVVLEKLANAFLNHPIKEAESNVFKSLRLINDFVQSTTSVALLKLLVSKTLHGIFEVIMFHSQRQMALSTVKAIVSSPVHNNIQSELEDNVIQITEKHLAFNTQNYFQLLNYLAKLIPATLKNLIPRIKQKITNVERMRGVGYDKNLRLNIERLETVLFQSS